MTNAEIAWVLTATEMLQLSKLRKDTETFWTVYQKLLPLLLSATELRQQV